MNKEKIADYKDRFLMILGGIFIMGFGSRLEQWITERKIVHLEWSIAFFLATCLCIVLPTDRILIAFGALAIVVAMGTWGTLISRNFAAVPLIIICAMLALILAKYKSYKIKPK